MSTTKERAPLEAANHLVSPQEAELMLIEFAVQDPVDWTALVERIGDKRELPDKIDELYAVEFLSYLPEDTSEENFQKLEDYDKLAYGEALRRYEDGRPSGLILYLPGVRQANFARSICVWTSRQAALDKMGPLHGQAAQFGASLYTAFYYNRFDLSRAGKSEEVIATPHIPVNLAASALV